MTALRRIGGPHPGAIVRRAIREEVGDRVVADFRHRPDLRAMRVYARAHKAGDFYDFSVST
jgi:hypothetical protein